MSESRTNGGRPRSRAFRPLLDGRLEDRVLMSSIASKVKDQLQLSACPAQTPGRAECVSAPTSTAFGSEFTADSREGAETDGRARVRDLERGRKRTGQRRRHSLSSRPVYTSNTLATNVAEGSNGQNGDTRRHHVTRRPRPARTIRNRSARFEPIPMSGGRVGLIVDGSTQNTELTINPLGQQQRKGYATSFAYGAANRGHILNIGQITDKHRRDR